MLDLSKVKEVISATSSDQDFVNEKLKTGKWVLLELKILEVARWQERSTGVEAHLRKYGETIYVIGRVK